MPRALVLFLLAASLFFASFAGASRPNVVLILSDDQRVDDMRFMPKTRQLLTNKGTTFTQMFAPFPLCCPARMSILTGQYSHNHGVEGNFPPEGYFGLSLSEQKNTLPVWLQRAGYKTAHIGKYLNGYGSLNPLEVPPGWSDWQGTIDQTSYDMFNYWINDNGKIAKYGDDAWNRAIAEFSRRVALEEFATYRDLQNYILANIIIPFGGASGTFGTVKRQNHQVDVLAKRATQFINQSSKKPFFLQFAPPAPHREDLTENAGYTGINPRPPLRYEKKVESLQFSNSPSFNEADISDKPGLLSQLPLISSLTTIDNYRRGRAGNLFALDDAVARIVSALKKRGKLQNTLIIFHSDNGWILGEHRVVGDKYLAYEESLRVPTIIRGPGWPAGKKIKALSANVDLTRTILKATGAKAKRVQDGAPLGSVKRRAVFLEAGRPLFVKPGFPYPWDQPYFGVRTAQFKYIKWQSGEEELYNLKKDPHEMSNLAAEASYLQIKDSLLTLALKLKDCKGKACVSS